MHAGPFWSAEAEREAVGTFGRCVSFYSPFEAAGTWDRLALCWQRKLGAMHLNENGRPLSRFRGPEGDRWTRHRFVKRATFPSSKFFGATGLPEMHLTSCKPCCRHVVPRIVRGRGHPREDTLTTSGGSCWVRIWRSASEQWVSLVKAIHAQSVVTSLPRAKGVATHRFSCAWREETRSAVLWDGNVSIMWHGLGGTSKVGSSPLVLCTDLLGAMQGKGGTDVL